MTSIDLHKILQEAGTNLGNGYAEFQRPDHLPRHDTNRYDINQNKSKRTKRSVYIKKEGYHTTISTRTLNDTCFTHERSFLASKKLLSRVFNYHNRVA